jgi:protein O-mannosyl-transferase
MAADQIPREQHHWPRLLLICAFLALSTLVVYWPVLRHAFVNYDDTDYVTANPYVQAGLTAKGFAWVWHSDVARNWHPVTMLSHMLDCQLYGLRPSGHHLTNLLFHIANAVLLFLLLWKMTGTVWRSGVVAALFALHPLHVESVAWVAERKDVLSTFFFLLTVGAYGLRNGQSTIANGQSRIARSRAGYYWLALGTFALGLMSKPMLVTVPFVLLLLDFWPLGRIRVQALKTKVQSPKSAIRSERTVGRAPRTMHHVLPPHSSTPLSRLLLEKVPFLALSAASCVITFQVQHKGGAVLDVNNLPIGSRVANALMSYVCYLSKMVWPEHLTALYLRKVPWPSWEVGLAALALGAASVAVIRLARRCPYLAVGWFWYFGTLVPVIGLVQVGMQTMADRYTYIPLIGIFIALAWGGWDLVAQRRWPAVAPGVAAAVALAACAIATRSQLTWWASSETLFQRMIAVNAGNYMAHYNMGNLFSRQDNLKEAARHYEAALAAEPNYAEAHNNLGAVLLRQGRFEEALAHYSTAVRLKPESMYYFNLANACVDAGKPAEAAANYQQALRLDPKSSQAHHNLGLALQAQGQAEAAMKEFQAALQLQPDFESAEHNLANRLADAGRLEEAMAHYQAALRLDPQHAENYNGLGICYAMQGKFADAERQFREAVRLKPSHSGAQSNLGNALGVQGKLEEAIPHYEKALAADPKDFQTHFNLAVSLVRLGRRAEAKAHLTEALRLHPNYPEAQKALADLDAGTEQRK